MVLDVDIWHIWTARNYGLLERASISVTVTRTSVALESCIFLVVVTQSSCAWDSVGLDITFQHKCLILWWVCGWAAEIASWVRVWVTNWLVGTSCFARAMEDDGAIDQGNEEAESADN